MGTRAGQLQSERCCDCPGVDQVIHGPGLPPGDQTLWSGIFGAPGRVEGGWALSIYRLRTLMITSLLPVEITRGQVL